LRIAGRHFAPAWWATLLTLAGVALTIALGFWQLGRAEQKQALQSRIDDYARSPPISLTRSAVNPIEVLLRPIEAHGRFDARHAVFLDNRVYKQQAGYYVLMPLRLADTDTFVLVNRGWIAAGMDRRTAPVVKTPQGDVSVRGTATAYSEHFLELSSKIAEGNIWQNIVLERYRQATRLELQPIILQQSSALDDGLVRDWPPVDLKRNTHLAYAVQWFGLAAAMFVYYLVVNVRSSPAA
jgi:surfeit locus 1 family protein